MDNKGCSSITSITINQPIAIVSSQSPTVCAGGSVVVGTHTYSTTGTYMDVLTSFMGCDSTITTHLTVQNAIDISTSVTSQTITSNQNGASYQWINCGNGNTPINGATSQNYLATSNGTYAVMITLNGCVNTSTCVTIATTGIHSISSSNELLNVYPNPNSGSFTLNSKTENTYYIINELGQTIQTLKLDASNNYEANIQGLTSGVYYIVNVNSNTPVRKRIIITN